MRRDSIRLMLILMLKVTQCVCLSLYQLMLVLLEQIELAAKLLDYFL